ncbi:MAG: response regulator [Ferruginibacter sp.]
MSKPTLPTIQKKILIIEDEGDICFLLNIILKDQQIDVEHVNTLSQAKVFLAEKDPALVFLDNSLPDGRGTDFIAHIKTNNPSTKIIMITAFNSASERERALKNGADLFLEKPFNKKQIYEAVNALLELDIQAPA